LIKSLSIRNFMQIPELDLDFTTPLTFIGGQNEAGKSSIRDAILWGFTGHARGLKTHAEQAAFIREGAKSAEVTITLDDGHAFTRRKTQKTAAGVFGDIPNINLHPAILCDPYTFLGFPEAERRELLFKVIPGLNPTMENIFTRLINWPGLDEIANKEIATEETGPKPAILLSGIAKMASTHGFPAAEKEAVIKRREAKRVRESLGEVKEPEKTITVDNKEYSIPTLNFIAIEGTLKDLQAEKDILLRQKGGIEAQEKRRETIKRQLEKLAATPLPPAADFIRQLEQDLQQNTEASIAIAEEIKQAAVPEQFFPATCPAITLEPMACPKAGMRVGNTPPAPGVVESLVQNRQGLLKTGNEIRAKLSEARQQVEVYQAAMTRKATLEEESARLEIKSEADAPDLDAEIATRERRISRGRSFQSAILNYNTLQAQFLVSREKIATCETEIIIYDLLAKALAPAGIPSQIVAEALDGVNELLDEAATYLFPGRYLHLTSDLDIVLQKSPYVTLSKSAKYRVGIAFQYALARLVGARMLLIDEADILDSEHKLEFLDFLLAHLSDFDQIMVFVTTDSAIPACPDPRTTTWWLENGQARKVA
jgi:DNA repair exonuclease SbcCD ATPase subunit